MSCNDQPKTSSCSGGCGCSAPSGTPWMGALMDPALRRKVLKRFWREMALGAMAGLALAGLGLLLADRLGPLGPALGGPWLRLHAGALVPAAMAAGITVALRTGRAFIGTLLASGLCLALGGALNGLLEAGEALPSHAAAFLALGLPLAAAGALAARALVPGEGA